MYVLDLILRSVGPLGIYIYIYIYIHIVPQVLLLIIVIITIMIVLMIPEVIAEQSDGELIRKDRGSRVYL